MRPASATAISSAMVVSRMGIRFDKGKSYDGILRIKSDSPKTVYISLRDEKGTVIAEEPYSLKGDGSYERVQFKLVPDADATRGSFGISLKKPGKIELGFAFLQPGEWL